jgi:hypothetical protein
VVHAVTGKSLKTAEWEPARGIASPPCETADARIIGWRVKVKSETHVFAKLEDCRLWLRKWHLHTAVGIGHLLSVSACFSEDAE